MFLAITLLLVAILCGFGIARELRRRNFFAVGFASISFIVFGAFSIATIVSILVTGEGAP